MDHLEEENSELSTKKTESQIAFQYFKIQTWHWVGTITLKWAF